MIYISIILSIYMLIKTISYGIYEIKEQKNKLGGLTLIIITSIAIIYANIKLFLTS